MDAEMATLRAAKKLLRTSIRQRTAQVSSESIQTQSSEAAKALLSMPAYKNAQNIGIYLSMPKGEVMTKAIVGDAFEQGKQIFVPYMRKALIEGKTSQVMNMASLHSKHDYESIKPGFWGIPSIEKGSIPQRQLVLCDNEKVKAEENTNAAEEEKRPMSRKNLDLILMPGVAFDRKCARLGHGKGNYDFFLQRYHDSVADAAPRDSGQTVLVGLALEEQLVSKDQEIPMNESDWRLDALVVGDGSVIRQQKAE